MSEHLTFDEIIQVINKSPESLAKNRYVHFKECEICQSECNNQLSADSVLKNIQPKSAPGMVLKNVLNKLEQIVPSKVKEKTDWTFLIAIVLLFSIGSWFIFSGKVGTYIKQYAPQVVTEQEKVEDFTIIDSIKEFFSGLSFELPDLNFGNFYLAIGILAILFYMLIDRKYSRNFKVHKT